MQEYTRKSLLDDGIREDSDFFEYVGRMRSLTDLAEYILEKSKGRGSFENKAHEILGLTTDIHEIRLNHFNSLVENNNVVEISEKLSNGTKYIDYVEKIDKEIEDELNDLKFSLNNNYTIDAMRSFDKLKNKLQRIKGIDQFLYDKSTNRINKTLESHHLDTATFSPRHQGIPNVNQSYSAPNQRVPNPRQSYIQPQQPIYAVPPQPAVPQYNYGINVQPAQPISPMPPHMRPVMHQGGPNPIPARHRKEEKETNKNTKKQSKVKKFVITAVATAACIGGLAVFAPGQTIDTPTQPTPSVPTQEPTVMQPGTMPSVTENPFVIDPATANFETPETEPTVTVTPTISQETHQKYDKHSLMYCLEFMDDELVSVIADSLRNSIDNCTAVQISMYGNGCNMTFSTDREYVAHVFGILDSRAKDMRYYGNSPDRFAIAPQMEQLSGDVSKYLIAKAIGESGKYDKDNYSIDDIDYYYSIYGGTTKSFDARTVKTKNGTLVEDELVGRSVHFSGDLKTLLNAHCTLNAAIEGSGTKDLLTGNYTLCAFGTQEGNVINDTSIDAYKALVNIFQSEYELKVPAQGKGVKIVYDKEYDR